MKLHNVLNACNESLIILTVLLIGSLALQGCGVFNAIGSLISGVVEVLGNSNIMGTIGQAMGAAGNIAQMFGAGDVASTLGQLGQAVQPGQNTFQNTSAIFGGQGATTAGTLLNDGTLANNTGAFPAMNPGALPPGLGNRPAATGRPFVNVPMRTQFEPANGKYQKSWCGPTALAMVYDYYGRKESTASVANRTYDFVRRNGTVSGRLVQDARKNGFPNTTEQYGVDFNYLQNNLSQGKPVIVGVEVNWKNGHYMVVVGLEGNKVIVNDPGRSQVRREFDRSWFLTQWNGRNRRAIVVQ